MKSILYSFTHHKESVFGKTTTLSFDRGGNNLYHIYYYTIRDWAGGYFFDTGCEPSYMFLLL